MSIIERIATELASSMGSGAHSVVGELRACAQRAKKVINPVIHETAGGWWVIEYGPPKQRSTYHDGLWSRSEADQHLAFRQLFGIGPPPIGTVLWPPRS